MTTSGLMQNKWSPHFGSLAKLTWSPSGFTYFAWDPKGSWSHEHSKNRIHLLITPLAWFLVKYRGHHYVMIIGLFPLPFDCGWCRHPVFTVVGPFFFDLGCPGGHLSATGPGGPLAPSCPVFPALVDSRQAIGPVSSECPLLWVALLISLQWL